MVNLTAVKTQFKLFRAEHVLKTYTSQHRLMDVLVLEQLLPEFNEKGHCGHLV